MDRELAELREEIEKVLPLLRLLEQLDLDLRNRDDSRKLREALRLLQRLRDMPNIDSQFDLLRRLREIPNFDAHLAMLADMYESKLRVRAEVRGVGWHALKQAAAAAFVAAASALGAIFWAKHGG